MQMVSCKVMTIEMTMIANEHFNCRKMVSCKVTRIENQEYRWHKGALGAPWGCRGVRGH